MKTDELRFLNLNDLARLPYFEVRGGRLVLADPALGPTVDVHTHLTQTFVRRELVDLTRETPETRFYLPVDVPLDLDIYVNQNIPRRALRQMDLDLTLGCLHGKGMRCTHTLPNLRREMGELGITQSCLLPIEWPALSNNSERYLSLTQGAEDIVCFGSIHPFDPRMRPRLDALVRQGARGIKVHPAVQLIRPDMPQAMRLYRLCGERKLPVLFHCGPVNIEPPLGRYFSQVRFYEKALAENPETIFVLGHSGALQMELALSFALKYPNVYLEISSQPANGVRCIVKDAPSDKVLFGTDWPFYHQAVALAKVLIVTRDDEAARRRVLYDNAARLFRLPPRTVS